MKNLKIFSDFACPYCYITMGIVEKLREDGLDFSVEWLPYEIGPDTPAEGKDLMEKLGEKKFKMLFKSIERIAKPYSNVNYHETPKMIFNSRKALLAGEYAKTIGRFEDFAQNTFEAVFLDLEDINKDQVLERIALKSNMDPYQMMKAINERTFDKNLEEVRELASKIELKEVPTFLIDNKEVFINVRKYDELKEKLS